MISGVSDFTVPEVPLSGVGGCSLEEGVVSLLSMRSGIEIVWGDVRLLELLLTLFSIASRFNCQRGRQTAFSSTDRLDVGICSFTTLFELSITCVSVFSPSRWSFSFGGSSCMTTCGGSVRAWVDTFSILWRTRFRRLSWSRKKWFLIYPIIVSCVELLFQTEGVVILALNWSIFRTHSTGNFLPIRRNRTQRDNSLE